MVGWDCGPAGGGQAVSFRGREAEGEEQERERFEDRGQKGKPSDKVDRRCTEGRLRGE